MNRILINSKDKILLPQLIINFNRRPIFKKHARKLLFFWCWLFLFIQSQTINNWHLFINRTLLIIIDNLLFEEFLGADILWIFCLIMIKRIHLLVILLWKIRTLSHILHVWTQSGYLLLEISIFIIWLWLLSILLTLQVLHLNELLPLLLQDLVEFFDVRQLIVFVQLDGRFEIVLGATMTNWYQWQLPWFNLST